MVREQLRAHPGQQLDICQRVDPGNTRRIPDSSTGHSIILTGHSYSPYPSRTPATSHDF